MFGLGVCLDALLICLIDLAAGNFNCSKVRAVRRCRHGREAGMVL